jgi:hypothetical protein
MLWSQKQSVFYHLSSHLAMGIICYTDFSVCSHGYLKAKLTHSPHTHAFFYVSWRHWICQVHNEFGKLFHIDDVLWIIRISIDDFCTSCYLDTLNIVHTWQSDAGVSCILTLSFTSSRFDWLGNNRALGTSTEGIRTQTDKGNIWSRTL